MKLQDYKNIASLGICTVSLVSCILYHYGLADILFRKFPFFMGLYFAADLTVNKSIEYRIHHITCIVIAYYPYIYKVSPAAIDRLTYHFMKTELSTFFLVFRHYLPKDTRIYQINNYVFYATFAKVRIHDLYWNVVNSNSSLYSLLNFNTRYHAIGACILVSSCYTLYALNLYWFAIMNRHLYRKLVGNRNEHKE